MDQKKIGKYIADKRKAAGMTQVTLAEKLGVSDKSVSKWERGICLPDISKYQDLCEILGISLNELFAGEDLDEINIVQQSEKNIIGVAQLGKIKNKKLFKVVVILLICIGMLTAGLVWVIGKEHLLMGDYITPYALENYEASALVQTYGKATLFEYSLDYNYKNMNVEIEEYRYGKLINTVTDKVELREYRNKKSIFGITPKLGEGVINFTCSFDGVVTYHDVALNHNGFEDWDEFKIESVRGLGYKAVKKHE